MPPGDRIGVIYLMRCAEGPEPAIRFIESYRRHRPGLPHDLHVIFKGFDAPAALAPARELFDGLPIKAIELDDGGFDIGSYRAAAAQVSNDCVLFLNTFSRILADDWLASYWQAFRSPRAGLVGASGSWQSNASNAASFLIWARLRRRLRRRRRPAASASALAAGHRPAMPRRTIPNLIAAIGNRIYFLIFFPLFPNPHIRTNAFMIERQLFLSLTFPRLRSKYAAWRFESGYRSLTRQIARRGLEALVIGRNGTGFVPDRWQGSATLWEGEQENLVIADNQTDDYAHGTAERRKFLNAAAWLDPARKRGKA